MLRLLQTGHQLIRQIIEIGPKLLFTQITTGAKREANNRSPRPNRLLRLGVIQRNASVLNQSRHHLNPIHFWSGCQTPGELQHIERLTTGVSITPQLEIP